MVGILSSRNMEKLLANASLELDLEKLKETYESPVRSAKVTLLSAVSSVFLSNTDTEKLDSNVSFAFTLHVSPGLGRGISHTAHPIAKVPVGPQQPSFPQPHPLCSFLTCASGPLHLLCPLPGTPFLQDSVLYLSTCLHVTYSSRPSWTCLFKLQSVITPHLSPLLFSFAFSTC